MMIGTAREWSIENYEYLDKKIQNLVMALHQLGIRTWFSCEGHIKTSSIYVGVKPWPYVLITVIPKELEELSALVAAWNKSNFGARWVFSERRIHGSWTPEYREHELKQHHPGARMFCFCPLEENLQLSGETLRNLQEQGEHLAFYLAGRVA